MRRDAEGIRQKLLADEIYIPPAPYNVFGGSARLLLVYPNRYFLGMSNLGFLYIYKLLNESGEVACERGFFEEGLDRCGFESGGDAGKFDAILFTLPFEMDALNLIRWLDRNGIPARADQRTPDHPLIIAGGSSVTLNPRFLLPFVDATFAGDAEPALPPMIAALKTIRASGKTAVVRRLEEIDGFVTARRIEREGIIAEPEITAARGCFNSIATPNTEFGACLLVEVERGCPFKCRFCTEGFARRTIVDSSPLEIEEVIRAAERHHLRVGMVGSALLSSKIWKTEREVWEESAVNFTFASLRADKLTDENAATVGRYSRSITIAPEAGSDRMQKLINKRMNLDGALQRLAHASTQGISQVKLYFIYGFPFETPEDIDSIVRFCEKTVKLGLITKVSLNPFIPKPRTPFQWLPMKPLGELKKTFSYLRERLKKIGAKAVSGYSPREAVVQAFIISAWESDADVIEGLALGTRHMTQETTDRVHQMKPKDHPFPWDALKGDITRDELYRDLDDTLSNAGEAFCRPAKSVL